MSSDSNHHIGWVLFDAVGTLFWPDPPVAVAYQQAGERFGCSLSEEIVDDRFRKAYRREFAERHGPIDEAAERQRWQAVVGSVFPESNDPVGLFEHLWSHFAEPAHWRLAVGSKECLQAFRERGYTPGIASNFDGRLRRICCDHGLPIEGRHLFISSEIGFAKPNPRFYEKVGTRLECQPSEILLVGDDRVNDYEAPLAAGWKARLVGQNESLAKVLNELPDLPASDGLP